MSQSRNLGRRMAYIRNRKKLAKEKAVLIAELNHWEEVLRDYDRLNYVLPNGKPNVHQMSDRERKGIEAHIKLLKEKLAK